MYRIILKNAATGKELVWRRVKIRKSLDDICHTLEAELAPSERLKVRKHDRIEARYESPHITDSGGARRVTTVLADGITAEAGEHRVTVWGRSPARDIIDSSWSGDYNRMTLRQLTRAVGKKFGIVCDTFPTDKPDPTGIVRAFRLENESPWAKLTGEADNQGFIFTSSEAGNLYLWPVPALSGTAWGFHLTEGVSIKNISWTENGSEQYHEYVVSGGFVDPPVKVIDTSCPGGRVRTIDITRPGISEAELRRRAETEMRRRRESRVTVTAPGWGLTDGQIKRLGGTAEKEIFFVPNLLVPVKCPSIGLEAALLVSEVEYEAGPDRFGCTVTVVNKEAYQ